MKRSVPMTPERRLRINTLYQAAADAISALANAHDIPEDERLGCLTRLKNHVTFECQIFTAGDTTPEGPYPLPGNLKG